MQTALIWVRRRESLTRIQAVRLSDTILINFERLWSTLKFGADDKLSSRHFRGRIRVKQPSYVTSSAKTCLMEGERWYDLIRRRVLCAATDPGLPYLLPKNIYSEYLCRSLCSINNKYYHKRVKTADVGWHCLFLHKASFHRQRHI